MPKKSQFSMDLSAILSSYPRVCVNTNIIDLITKNVSVEFAGMTHVGCLGLVLTLMNIPAFVYMIMNGT